METIIPGLACELSEQSADGKYDVLRGYEGRKQRNKETLSFIHVE